jgi:hypothetical protein
MKAFFKITDQIGNVYLLRVKNGKTSLTSRNDSPCGLSYITEHAGELSFSLEDADTPEDVYAALKQHVWPQMTVETWSPTKAGV